MAITNGGFMTFVIPAEDADKENVDFRQVPKTDRGNADYRDRGQFGSFQTSPDQFPNPDGVVLFTGYGADEADLVRGYCAPAIREDPAYDKAAYQDRWTRPMEPNEDMGETDVMRQDNEFRGRNQKARGFLTRPRVPTERG